MLVGQEFARDTLRLDQRVEFRKTKVYYMEGLNSSLCPKVDDEMLVCLKNVICFFPRNEFFKGILELILLAIFECIFKFGV